MTMLTQRNVEYSTRDYLDVMCLHCARCYIASTDARGCTVHVFTLRLVMHVVARCIVDLARPCTLLEIENPLGFAVNL